MPSEHDDGLKHAYITTRSGRKFHPLAVESGDVCLEDVAHALSMIPRFAGHPASFYSVAQHSLLVEELARLHGEAEEDLLRACLLHDAHEAYVGDVPSPLKRLIPGWYDFEELVSSSVREALMPDCICWAETKLYDDEALHLEASRLFRPAPDWVVVPRSARRVEPWSPLQQPAAFRRFLNRASELGL